MPTRPLVSFITAIIAAPAFTFVADYLINEDDAAGPLPPSLEFHHGSWKFGEGAMMGEQVPTENHMATIKPAELLRSDEKFLFTGKWEFNASYGIAPLDRGRFLIAQNTTLLADDGKTMLNQARLVIANADEKAGLVIVKP